MSFALTTSQVRARTKTVTRRLGWTFLKAGDEIRAVEKCQGLKKGEKVVPLATLRIESVMRESLGWLSKEGPYGAAETRREGFPTMTGKDFAAFFAKTHGCRPGATVTRIEFSYVTPEAP